MTRAAASTQTIGVPAMLILLVQMICGIIPLATSGTLVVVIPTRDGLVVAADSRSTVLGQSYDGAEKLQLANTETPTLVTITGTSDFANAPPPGVSLMDWMPKATYKYRGTAFVVSYLGKRQRISLSETTLMETAKALTVSLQDFLKSEPLMAAQFSNKELCRLVLCQASAKRGQIYGTVALRVDAKGLVSVESPLVKVFRDGDPKSLEFIGEDRYVVENVFGGVGQRFLSQESVSIWNKKNNVSDFAATDAARLATAILRATELTTGIVPVPSGNGVGGPTRVYVVTPKRVSAVIVQ